MRVTAERLKARVEQLREQGVRIRPGLDSVMKQNQEAPQSSTKTHIGNDAETAKCSPEMSIETAFPVS